MANEMGEFCFRVCSGSGIGPRLYKPPFRSFKAVKSPSEEKAVVSWRLSCASKTTMTWMTGSFTHTSTSRTKICCDIRVLGPIRHQVHGFPFRLWNSRMVAWISGSKWVKRTSVVVGLSLFKTPQYNAHCAHRLFWISRVKSWGENGENRCCPLRSC